MMALFFGHAPQEGLPYPQGEMFVIFDATTSANEDKPGMIATLHGGKTLPSMQITSCPPRRAPHHV
jgi:hypothetical protein